MRAKIRTIHVPHVTNINFMRILVQFMRYIIRQLALEKIHLSITQYSEHVHLSKKVAVKFDWKSLTVRVVSKRISTRSIFFLWRVTFLYLG